MRSSAPFWVLGVLGYAYAAVLPALEGGRVGGTPVPLPLVSFVLKVGIDTGWF